MLNRPRPIDILEFEDLQADLESLVTLKTGASEIMGIFATCVMADESIKGIVDALKTAFSSFQWNKKAITDVVDVVGEINAAADWSHDSVKAHLEALEGIVENIKKVCVNFDPTLRVNFDTTVVKVMVECVTGLVKAENVHADTTSLASSLLEHFISAFPNNNMLLNFFGNVGGQEGYEQHGEERARLREVTRRSQFKILLCNVPIEYSICRSTYGLYGIFSKCEELFSFFCLLCDSLPRNF